MPSKLDNIKRGGLRDQSGLNFQNTVRAVSSRINLANNSEDLAARTVFWKFSPLWSRSPPRLMLSSFDGTQACVPSGEITMAPR